MRPRHLITLAIVVVVLALGVWSFWDNVVDPHPAGAPLTDASLLPQSLAGLALATSLEGVEAKASVEQLHGKGLGAGLDEACVGDYRGAGTATLWVSRSVDVKDAEDLLARMTDRIAEGGSPFTGLTPIEKGGVRVYRLEGMGQVHYYFLSGRDVYWLAIDPALAESGLGELLASAGA
ncbi:MAG: hypothetical protein ACYC5Q_12600 [Thermoleophilia bacterium]